MDGHPRKDIFECLTFNSFPLSHESVLFCYIYRESYPSHINGWNVYDPIQVRYYITPSPMWCAESRKHEARRMFENIF